MKRLFLGILLLVSLLSISANEDLTAWTADRIWTANPNQPWAQVVISKGKRMVRIGEEIECYDLSDGKPFFESDK